MNMNYWAIPGEKRVVVFKQFDANGKKELRYCISISPNCGTIRFFYGAIELMQLEIGQKINFVFIDEILFFYKSSEGVSIRNGIKKLLRTQSRTLGKYLKTSMKMSHMKTSYSFVCNIHKTNYEFDGNVLFQVDLPTKIKHAVIETITYKNFNNYKQHF